MLSLVCISDSIFDKAIYQLHLTVRCVTILVFWFMQIQSWDMMGIFCLITKYIVDGVGLAASVRLG